jgi:uncharacterized protein (TIGR03067 family)
MKQNFRTTLVLSMGLMTAITYGDDSKVELAKFNGNWELVTAVTDGKEMAPEIIKTIRVVIKDGRHTVYLGQTVVAKEIPFTVDSSTVPNRTIDTLPDGKKIKGIYKLEGETLTSCIAAADQDFPTEFSSRPGTGYVLRVFKRGAEEQQSLTGTWVPTEAELAGVKLPVESLKNWKLTLNAEQYRFENGHEVDQGTWTRDTSKTPQTMDITGTDGPNKGKTILAICQFSKEGLKICYDLGGKNRPTEFMTKPGTPLFLVNYQRK